MTLTAAEHALAQRAHQDARNAYGRARRWCDRYGATVTRWETAWGNPRWTVKVVGFHPVTADTLEHAVAPLAATIAHFCHGTATHGPTGAKLDRLRALRGC